MTKKSRLHSAHGRRERQIHVWLKTSGLRDSFAMPAGYQLMRSSFRVHKYCPRAARQ